MRASGARIDAPAESHARCAARRPTRGNARPFLDRLPIGVLIYRLSHLLYANKAFLDWTGSDSLDALAEAGGLDSLMIESGDIAVRAGRQQAVLDREPQRRDARRRGAAAAGAVGRRVGLRAAHHAARRGLAKRRASLDRRARRDRRAQRDPRHRHRRRDRARSRRAHRVGEPQRAGAVRLRRARARRQELRRSVRAGEHRHRRSTISNACRGNGPRGAAQRRQRDRSAANARAA